MFVQSAIALLAFSQTTLGIAFPGPAPTAVGELNLHGFSPKPTGGPPSLPALFRRQQKDDAMCGYLAGDSDAPVSCSVGTCLYDDTISWFGCCTGTVRSDCELFTTCVGSASISSCLGNSACANDAFALACTESTAGVCMTMWGEVEEGSVSHFVCGSTSARVQVVATPTAGAGSISGAASPTSVSGLPRSSASVDDDGSSSAAPTSRAGTSSSDDRPRINTAVTAATRTATSTQSTAGAVKTAQAVLGAAGGFAGFVACSGNSNVSGSAAPIRRALRTGRTGEGSWNWPATVDPWDCSHILGTVASPEQKDRHSLLDPGKAKSDGLGKPMRASSSTQACSMGKHKDVVRTLAAGSSHGSLRGIRQPQVGGDDDGDEPVKPVQGGLTRQFGKPVRASKAPPIGATQTPLNRVAHHNHQR
ncbi:hypothetical protein OPT61_g4957 [Boeremia exigua]|uniref:Uncharacterized protein n=1 Tax=Boeremia exigua TaxID=749465 RepID=A0ACC2IC77_9PLEO|nr:hypothetical protein OPT61_g4957 [Boeremia exigua]